MSSVRMCRIQRCVLKDSQNEALPPIATSSSSPVREGKENGRCRGGFQFVHVVDASSSCSHKRKVITDPVFVYAFSLCVSDEAGDVARVLVYGDDAVR